MSLSILFCLICFIFVSPPFFLAIKPNWGDSAEVILVLNLLLNK